MARTHRFTLGVVAVLVLSGCGGYYEDPGPPGPPPPPEPAPPVVITPADPGCGSDADCPSESCTCSDGAVVDAAVCDNGTCDGPDAVCPGACQQAGHGDWAGASAPPQCTSDADCPSVECDCQDGAVLSAQACTNGSCEDASTLCPGACANDGGW